MRTLAIPIDEELDSALELLCVQIGRPKADLIQDALRRYVHIEQSKRALRDPSLMHRYEELMEEDVELAEQGMSEYQSLLEAADKA